MTSDEINEQTRAFLLENFIFDPSSQVGDDDSLMGNGVIDSTGILEVIMWVEQNFGVHVEDAEVLPDNFDSVNCISRYVERKVSDKTTAA